MLTNYAGLHIVCTFKVSLVNNRILARSQGCSVHKEGMNMAHTIEELLNLTDTQLDDIFTNAAVGDIPDGQAKGTAIVANGTKFSDEIANFVNFFAWQGKTFDSKNGVLRNRITHFGLSAIIAKVYKGPSWFDNKECIVLDYSDTSL